MGFLNNFICIGRPITDISFGYTKDSNVAYAYFMLAIPSYTVLTDGNPALVNPDDIIQCRAFQRVAKIIGKYLEKGEMVALQGQIKQDKTQSNKVYFWVKEVFLLKNYMKQKNSIGRKFYREYDKKTGEIVRIGDKEVEVIYKEGENEDGSEKDDSG